MEKWIIIIPVTAVIFKIVYFKFQKLGWTCVQKFKMAIRSLAHLRFDWIVPSEAHFRFQSSVQFNSPRSTGRRCVLHQKVPEKPTFTSESLSGKKQKKKTKKNRRHICWLTCRPVVTHNLGKHSLHAKEIERRASSDLSYSYFTVQTEQLRPDSFPVVPFYPPMPLACGD